MTIKRRAAIKAGLLAGMTGLIGLRPALAQWQSRPQSSPVVVELFTSQGCSSCPYADAFLGDLAKRKDVVALAYHVDYWDRLGWKDPFSSAWASELQTAYSRAHGKRNNYTPQMIINGRTDEIGSRRSAVNTLIAVEKTREQPTVGVTMADAGDGQVKVSIGGMDQGVEAEVVLLRFDSAHTTPVGRGENAGRTLTNYNVVRERRVLGRWRGDADSFTVPAPADPATQGMAVLVQVRNQGPILGAGVMSPAAS